MTNDPQADRGRELRDADIVQMLDALARVERDEAEQAARRADAPGMHLVGPTIERAARASDRRRTWRWSMSLVALAALVVLIARPVLEDPEATPIGAPSGEYLGEARFGIEAPAETAALWDSIAWQGPAGARYTVRVRSATGTLLLERDVGGERRIELEAQTTTTWPETIEIEVEMIAADGARSIDSRRSERAR